MRVNRRVIQAVAEVDRKAAVVLACKLMGLDTSRIKDEDVWRTSEEGKHFKFDNETGEIKAGFGGKFNGKKLGNSWGTKSKGRGKAEKSEHSKPAKPNNDREDFEKRGIKEALTGAQNHVDFWMNLPESEQKKIQEASDPKEELNRLYESAKAAFPEHLAQPEWKPANGTVADMPKNCKVPNQIPEINIINNPQDTATAHAGESGKIEINLANFDPENADGVIAHEAAHQLSNYDPDLQQAIMMNYGNVLGRYNQEKGYFDGIYGEYNPEEAFATGFSNYRNYPEQMKEKYPEAYAFFDELAKNQPETMEFIDNTVKKAKQRILAENASKNRLNETEKSDIIKAGSKKVDLQQFAKTPKPKPVTRKERAILEHAVMTYVMPNLTEAEKENGLILYEYGGHQYLLDISENGFDILSKKSIDESAAYYDMEYSRWKDGTRSEPIGQTKK